MSFQSYTVDARDGKRKRDLGIIRTALEMHQIKNTKLPIPDEKLTYIISGTLSNTIAIQGYLGTNAQKEIKIINEVKDDDSQNIYYTYSINGSKTKYQLLSMLEKEENLAMSNLINSTYGRFNYESRNPYSIGDYAVFFSGTSNTPIQVNQSTQTGELNLVENNTQYKVIISGTGTRLFTASGLPSIIKSLTESNTFVAKNSSCNYNGITINSGESLVVYETANVNYGNTCKSGIVSCNNGIVSGDTTYIATSCMVGIANNCNAGNIIGTITTYTYSSFNHGNTITGNGTNGILHGTQNFTSSLSCNNGIVSILSETAGIRNCTDGYTGISCDIPPNPYQNCTGQNTPTPFLSATIYPGCNSADIIVCSGVGTGYTISACNVGATTASINWATSRGQYFQWGRNKGFVYGDISQQATTIDGSVGLNVRADTYGFVWNSSLPSPNSWANTNITNNWGNTTNTSEARKGPCSTGYHVPSQIEWSGIINAGKWGTNGINLQTALKLPYVGIRNWGANSFSDGGMMGYYWTSSLNSGNGYAYAMVFHASYISATTSDRHAFGYAVRCFKN